MEVPRINRVTKNHRELEKLLADYQEIFGTELGKYKGVKAHLFCEARDYTKILSTQTNSVGNENQD